MRGKIPTIFMILSVLALPAVAADDPGLTIPDTAPVVDHAEASAHAQVEATQALTRGAFWETSQGVNEAQELNYPASRLSNLFNHTRDYGVATVGGGHGLVATTTSWSSAEITQKLDEVEAVLLASDAIGQAGLEAAAMLTQTLLNVLCSSPISPDDPTGCHDGSVAQAVQDEVNGLLERGGEESSEDRFTATQAAAKALVGTIVPLP